MSQLRIGTLGAARITPNALIRPARDVEGVVVAAVAARDTERARQFAAKNGIPKIHASYDEVIADPQIDAIYNPLPNGLHGRWTIASLAAGKHVLCEKPFTSNSAEARAVADAAQAAKKVVMEAFHYRYHPLAERMVEVVRSGELGEIQEIHTWVCFPLPNLRDIRYQYDLAGGATMDAGCYAIHMLRTLGGEEPEVVSARARMASAEVDRAMTAELAFPSGYKGRMTCSMLSARLLHVAARVAGSRGRMDVWNPLAPQYFSRLTVRSDKGRRRESLKGDSTYTYQLRSFASAVEEGTAFPTAPSDSIANMAVIDAVYRAAGLKVRGT